MNFKEIYKSANASLKNDFLDLLMADNKKLENQFIEFWKESVNLNQEEAMQLMSFASLVNKYKESYMSVLEKIDLEINWDDDDGLFYRDDWEIVQEEGDEQIEEIFENIKSELLNLVLLQDVKSLLAAFIGLYEACKQIEIEDENGAYEDINEELINQFTLFLSAFAEKINALTFDDNKTIKSVEDFFYYQAEYHNREKYFIVAFEPLLLAFATVTKQANTFLNILSSSKVFPKDVPQLHIKLLQLSADDNEWTKIALGLYKNNDGVAIQLLEYYLANDSKKYVELAKELFEKDNYIWSMYLKDMVSIEQDKELFFMVFKYLTLWENSLDYYLKIRDLFDENSFNLFCEDLEGEMFLIDILALEKKHETIKLIIKQVEDWDWDFNQIIEPILNVYPDFCFDIIKKRLIHVIADERGREYYNVMAKTLLLAKQIKGFETQSHDLMLQLYNHKPNLPALRDEFRGMGLIIKI